jgi:hypothetical protein
MVGRPKKNDRAQLNTRVNEKTLVDLQVLAFKLGYIYGDKGSIGQLLDAIAVGAVVLTRVDKLE